MRIYDASLVHEASSYFLSSEHKVDAIDWVSKPENIVLQNNKGDLALFEIGVKKVYSGHYYFKSRGKQAIQSAKEFLDELFNSCYNIIILMGLVPDEKKHVKWLSRQVGFKSYGKTNIDEKIYEMFIITKEEFNK
jgi:hypothetical protein